MSKKSKRSSRSSSTHSGVAQTSVIATPIPQSAPAGGRSGEKGFNPDYSDVIKDLKRIGMLAGTFFTIMIILSFFLK